MSTRYKLLVQQRADLMQRTRGILEGAEGGNRTLTDAEVKTHADIMGQVKKLNRDLEVAEAGLAAERIMEPVVDINAPTRAQAEILHDGNPVMVSDGARSKRNGKAKSFRAMFPEVPLSLEGWATSEEFYSAIASGQHNPALVPMAVHTSDVPSAGGFSVPTEVVADLLDASLEGEIVRPRADVTPMTSEKKRVWGFDASTASGSTLFGGFTGQWTEEAGTITLETAKTRKIELVAKKLGLLTEASNELLGSGVSFRDQLENAIIRALGWFLDDAFLNGTGAGQPLGVLNDLALIAVPKEGGQAADTIRYENVVKMFARLHPALVEDAVFVVNPTTIPQLLTMSLVIGTGGSHIPVMTETGNGFRMLGRDVLLTEKLPTLGDQGDIILAAFSQYAVGLRAEMSLDRSQHVGFARDVETFRGILRGDGQGKWSGAYTPKTGSTLSWAVTLAERA